MLSYCLEQAAHGGSELSVSGGMQKDHQGCEEILKKGHSWVGQKPGELILSLSGE